MSKKVEGGRVAAPPGSSSLRSPEPVPVSAHAGNDPSRMFWIELREPKCVPDRKGPYPRHMMTGVIRDCMKYRPTAYITVITWHDLYGPCLSDGPEWLMIRDGRSRSTALAHIRHTAAAHRDTDGSPTGRDAQRLDGVAATAGAGTASPENTTIPTPSQPEDNS